MASWKCGGIAQYDTDCASNRGVATEAMLLPDCVRASVICKLAAVDRLPVVLYVVGASLYGLFLDVEGRCTMRDGLEALLDAVLSC